MKAPAAIPAASPAEAPTKAPARFQRRLRRDSGDGSSEGLVVVRRGSSGDSDEVVATPARQWGGGWKVPMNSGFTNKN